MKSSINPTVNVSISLPQTLRDAARQAAVEDQRTMSSLVASLLKDHLCAEGYLTADLRLDKQRFRRGRAR